MKGAFREECFEFEVKIDVCKARLDDLQTQINKSEEKWVANGIIWDGLVVKQCRLAPLAAAAEIMSKYAPLLPPAPSPPIQTKTKHIRDVSSVA